MIDWNRLVGQEFKGNRSGKYKIVDYAPYSSKKIKQWDGHNALYIQSLSSKGEKKYTLMVDVLMLMKKVTNLLRIAWINPLIFL